MNEWLTINIGPQYMEYLYGFLTFLIGCLAAFAELLSRYGDPGQILKANASRIYILINGISSAIAYIFITDLGIASDNTIMRILIAGTSALVILRSSLASIKVGENNVEAGIATILQVFLNWADRSFDQKKAKVDLPKVKPIMNNIDFDKAKLALPTTCFKIMKNVSQTEQSRIGTEIADLSNSDLDNYTKCVNLGIMLVELTGNDLLEQAVEVLRDSITVDSNADSSMKKLQDLMDKLKTEN